MFYKISIVVLGFTLFFVSGCTSKPNRDNKSTQLFETDITSNGSKRFTLSIAQAHRASGKGERQKRGQGEGGRGGNRGEGGQGGKRDDNSEQKRYTHSQSSNEDNRSKILARLDEKLAETAYCRNGYIELDYSSVFGKTEIRGECQESASNEDKEKW